MELTFIKLTRHSTISTPAPIIHVRVDNIRMMVEMQGKTSLQFIHGESEMVRESVQEISRMINNRELA